MLDSKKRRQVVAFGVFGVAVKLGSVCGQPHKVSQPLAHRNAELLIVNFEPKFHNVQKCYKGVLVMHAEAPIMIILFVIGLPLVWCEVLVLLDKTQQHTIPPQSNLPIEFTLNTILQQINYEAEINATLTLTQENSSFDLITFPADTVFGKQYSCYNQILELGIFYHTDCNMNCEDCSITCVRECFSSNETCCCKECRDDFYNISLLDDTSFGDIQSKNFIFIIDNSDFMGRSLDQSATITIGYTIFTSFNYKYKIIAIILAGIIGLLVLLELLFCLGVAYKTRKCNEALRLQKQQKRKV